MTTADSEHSRKVLEIVADSVSIEELIAMIRNKEALIESKCQVLYFFKSAGSILEKEWEAREKK